MCIQGISQTSTEVIESSTRKWKNIFLPGEENEEIIANNEHGHQKYCQERNARCIRSVVLCTKRGGYRNVVLEKDQLGE